MSTEINHEELNASGTEDLGTATQEASNESTAPAQEAGPVGLDEALAKAVAKHQGKESDETGPTTAQKAPAAAPTAQGKAVDPITGEEQLPINPPARTPPGIVAEWSKLPRTVQKYWNDRERDMQNKLNETQEERKLANEFKSIAAPYEATLRSANLSAPALTKSLFASWHTLATGNSVQKAQVMDNLMRQFGAHDPAMVQAFVAMSQNKPIPQQAAQAQRPMTQAEIEALADKRFEARQEEQRAASAQAEIDQMAKEPEFEFMNDVADTMTRAIQAGFVKGSTFRETIKKAYDFACANNPEIAKVLADRAASKPVATKQLAKPVQQIKPSLSGGKSSPIASKSMSLDEALKAAMEKHMK